MTRDEMMDRVQYICLQERITPEEVEEAKQLLIELEKTDPLKKYYEKRNKDLDNF